MKNVKFFCEALLLVKTAPAVDIFLQPFPIRTDRPKCFWGTALDLLLPNLTYDQAIYYAYIDGMANYFNICADSTNNFLFLENTCDYPHTGRSYYKAGVELLIQEGELDVLREMEASQIKPKKSLRLGARK